MPLNFNLLESQPSFAQQYLAGQQEAQQNRLREMQMQQAQEDRAFQLEQRKLQADREAKFDQIAGLISQHGMDPDDPKVLGQFAQAALQARNPAMVEFAGQMAERAAKRRQTAEVQRRIQTAIGGPSGPPVNTLAAAPVINAMLAPSPAQPDLLANTPFAIGLAPAPSAAAPSATDNTARVNELERRRLALEMGGTPQELAAAKFVERQIEQLKPKALPADAAMMQALGYPLTPAGYQAYRDAQRQERMLSPQEEAQRIRIAQASRPPREPGAPVAVVDEATGKVKYVSREEAMGKTPAAAMEGLSPKEIQKREAALPQATSAIKGFETKSDSFIRDLKALRDDPGLENITGPVFGRTPSVSAAGSRAQALFDKVTAKGGFQALQDLRDASKTGGALGNVSNQEGRQLTASFAAIDRRQNAADVRAAIDQAIADIEGSKTRMREAFDSTYSYKQQGAVPAVAPTPTSKPSVSNW